jgi:uncharacterized 2Fe-2S/4Fe-4S cluster protein (DUF4445 family)
MTEHLVVFTPSGKRGRFPDGTDLLTAARRLGVDLDSVCGGRGICGRCQVSLVEGEQTKRGIASSSAHATPPGETEARFQARRGALPPGRRLGCQAQLLGDLVVDVPEESQLHRQVVRKAATERPVAVDPVVTLHAVQVAEADMADPSSDGVRLLAALADQWGLAEISIPLPVLATLQPALRAEAHLVTAAVRLGREIVAVYPGVRTGVAGVAVDLGSTTIAAHLCDLGSGEVLASDGIMNPQIRFGDDVMSRVSYAMLNAGGAEAMTFAARTAVDGLVGSLCAVAGIGRDGVVEMTLVGNPVMHHLFLGLDPTELGQAPFPLAWDGPLDVPAAALGVSIAPGASIHALPCIAGHVGADAAAVVLAEAPYRAGRVTLIADIGTNAEIVLGDHRRLLACSSPTGPALEGAQLSSGQRAAPGAIERVRIDRETLEPRVRVIGCEHWSDAPGFRESLGLAGITGICGSGVIEAIAEMFLSGVVTPDGRIDGTKAARNPRIRPDGRSFAYVLHEGAPDVAITQQDIRAVQLAKAALHAGCKLLMARLAVAEIDDVRLAGAFGSQIDPLHALVLGLIPDIDPARVTAVGNAAGHGARIALVNRAARDEIAAVVRGIEKIETAFDPSFQAEFVAAMALPHATDAYSRLSQVLRLPEKVPAQGGGGRPARRS